MDKDTLMKYAGLVVIRETIKYKSANAYMICMEEAAVRVSATIKNTHKTTATTI